MLQDRMDHEKLTEAGRYLAQKFYEKKRSSSWKVVRMFRKLFGVERLAKKSVNESLNSMLRDTEETQGHAMDILKDIQRTSSRKSFFERRFRCAPQDIDTQLVQDAQSKLFAC